VNAAELAEWLDEVTGARDTIQGWGGATGTHPQLEAVVAKLTRRVDFIQAALDRELGK
jgi:hypothetical protein